MKKWIIIILTIIMTANIVSAFQTASENYNSTLMVITSGGTNVSSENYKSILAIAQIAYSNMSSENYQTQFGIIPFRFPMITAIVEEVIPPPPPVEVPGGEGFVGPIPSIPSLKGELLEIDLTLKYICTQLEEFIEEHTIYYTIPDLQQLQIKIFNETGKFVSSGLIADYVSGFDVFCGDRKNASSKYYDITVKVLKSSYRFGNKVWAEINIFNKGNVSDKNTVLVYYLTNPIGIEFNISSEEFDEIPAGETILRRELLLPSDGLDGKWRFNAKYFTSRQPTTFIFDSLQVKKKIKPSTILMLLIFIITIFIFLDSMDEGRNKRKDNKLKKEKIMEAIKNG